MSALWTVMKHEETNTRHHDPAVARPAGRLAVRALSSVAIAVGVAAVPIAGGTATAEDPGIDCAEWDGSRFSADAERITPSTIELSLTYDDTVDAPLDVCPYTIFFSLRDGDGTVVSAGSIGADDVAAATELTGSFDQSMRFGDCDWEVHLAVEESLPIVLESDEFCLDDLVIQLEPLVPLRPFPFTASIWQSVAALR